MGNAMCFRRECVIKGNIVCLAGVKYAEFLYSPLARLYYPFNCKSPEKIDFPVLSAVDVKQFLQASNKY